MPITEILKKNSDFYPNDVALVEINPKLENQTHPGTKNVIYIIQTIWYTRNSLQIAV